MNVPSSSVILPSAMLPSISLFQFLQTLRKGLLEALRLFVVFSSSLHACSHCLGYVSKASLRLRVLAAYGFMVLEVKDTKSLLTSRHSSTSLFRHVMAQHEGPGRQA